VLVLGVFVVVFLVYSNSFLIGPRTKEFGLLYLFGLSQRHLLTIMFYEVAITYAIATVFGLISGVILSRLMNMVLSAFIKMPLLTTQVVDFGNMVVTAGLFFAVMCVVLIINMWQIIRAKPISLMHHSDRAKYDVWRQYTLLIIGIVSMAYAYVAISMIDSPQRAYESMASIVLAFVVGTYCLFVSLSVTILQILAQRPEFYYRTNNFIIINGLLNRIRQNAIGLASVSMFALLILTMVSTAGVIYFGANESVQKLYAADVVMTIQDYNIYSKEKLHERITQLAESQGVAVELVEPYTFLSVTAIQSGNIFAYQAQNRVFVGEPTSHYFVMVTVGEYNQLYGQSLSLAPGEVAVYSSYRRMPETFVLDDRAYRVVKRLPALSIAEYDLQQLVNAHYLVVHDWSELTTHERNKYEQNTEFPSPIRYRLGVKMIGSDAQKLAVYQGIQALLKSDELINKTQQFPNPYIEVVNVQSRQAEKLSFEAVYGTLLFLSLFLGLLFMLSTALLIYYKQLTEGYDDKARFEILQRIGMTRDEVRTSVDKQIVVFFFIPLFVASINYLISLHLIEHLLELFRIESLQLLLSAAFVTLLTFTALYIIIYQVSARVYYNIVR
jgi:putative ABC transport system permease protein